MAAYDLVIFDFDGVIVDSETISARMLIAELVKIGVTLDMEYVARHFLGRSYPVVLSQIRKDFGVVLPDGFELDYRARLLAAFRRDLRAMPGVAGVLNTLSVPHTLATSSSPVRLAESLRIVDLAHAFPGPVTTASEVTHGKPAPDLFLLAASKFGVEPNRCLVVEDSRPGIRAGLAAGMTVWHFVGGGHFAAGAPPADTDALPHRQFASFDEFFHDAPDLKQRDTQNGA
ncbi:haloacid dehalogenase superfamily, subfamily IA, variant 3 with third motif having DD or ED [Poseidonocella pacifica]|uniref:Haloacid dehalogenase superfamily, subfamily IA, variant 3 with third motif having DD or ED n=1 Tax=Poseidonocella pacifica TaxID=871651 RepID=A0A1I0VAP2_9RHOB|nr:HAD family hydrolase [Poseidonocella pacifica]SFA73431.1 haloacid dehalogenase superfamily, subfamily IA, variant 3 with third motif having DD or ED [Poseidonocella pacifica]